MSVSREIAQARTYSSAYTVLCAQIFVAALIAGAVAPHWWWGLVVFAVIILMSLNRWTKFLVLIALSGFWAFLAQQISIETGAGAWSYLVGVIAFLIAYGVNATGMVGLEHSVPNFSS